MCTNTKIRVRNQRQKSERTKSGAQNEGENHRKTSTPDKSVGRQNLPLTFDPLEREIVKKESLTSGLKIPNWSLCTHRVLYKFFSRSQTNCLAQTDRSVRCWQLRVAVQFLHTESLPVVTYQYLFLRLNAFRRPCRRFGIDFMVVARLFCFCSSREKQQKGQLQEKTLRELFGK